MATSRLKKVLLELAFLAMTALCHSDAQDPGKCFQYLIVYLLVSITDASRVRLELVTPVRTPCRCITSQFIAFVHHTGSECHR